MRQPAHGCNFRAKQLKHFLLTDLFALIAIMLVLSLPKGLAGDHSG
jgi:hypothetical protein